MLDEAQLLKAYGELPKRTHLNKGIGGGLGRTRALAMTTSSLRMSSLTRSKRAQGISTNWLWHFWIPLMRENETSSNIDQGHVGEGERDLLITPLTRSQLKPRTTSHNPSMSLSLISSLVWD